MGLQLLRPELLIIEIERGGRPDPVIHVVAIADLAHLPVHHRAGHRPVRAHLHVIKGNVLDAVRAEDHQLPDILVVLFLIPPVIGVGPVAIAELMPADGISRRRCHIQRSRDLCGAARPLHRPQQAPHAEQRPARIGSHHPHHLPSLDDHPVAFRPRLGPLAAFPPGHGVAPRRVGSAPRSPPRRGHPSATTLKPADACRCVSPAPPPAPGWPPVPPWAVGRRVSLPWPRPGQPFAPPAPPLLPPAPSPRRTRRVAQASKPAVSPTSKSAELPLALRLLKPAPLCECLKPFRIRSHSYAGYHFREENPFSKLLRVASMVKEDLNLRTSSVRR